MCRNRDAVFVGFSTTEEESSVETSIDRSAHLALDATRLADASTFGLSTPCSEFTVRDLAAHMLDFARLTAHTAAKTLPEGQPLEVTAAWRSDYQDWVENAQEAWSDPEARTGMTSFGGDPLPGQRAAAITVVEFAIHAWDMARTFEDQLDVPDDLGKEIKAIMDTLAEPGRASGVFGPVVAVEGDLSAFEQALAASGRSPNR
jgi:uncharacterized protein (TIGR03086 family)